MFGMFFLKTSWLYACMKQHEASSPPRVSRTACFTNVGVDKSIPMTAFSALWCPAFSNHG